MGELSIWHWLIVLIVILLLFGSGKVSHLMGDFAKGIKAFKQNMQDDDTPSKASAGQAKEPPQALSAAASEAKAQSAEKTPVHHEA
ncbi:MAG: twin-arginine translocase TatA/TatE family subunit [Acetobacteraceae bacterium]